jgi:acyl carrier protein
VDHGQNGSTMTNPGGATLPGLAALLCRATGEGAGRAAEITADTLLEADLGIDSLEMAELNVLLRDRFGSGIDLLAFLGTLDIEQIINLTVGDLLAHLAHISDFAPTPGERS